MKKSLLDKFYTKLNIADYCIQFVIDTLQNNVYNIKNIIEPSAGSGSFSLQFKDFYWFKDCSIQSFDIEPTHPSITKLDFLSQEIKVDKNTIIIGNPPFGKQCSDAIKFFNKSASYKGVDYICFIVPPSFKKDSIQNKLDLNFELINQIDLPTNSFINYANNTEFILPTIFQVWKRTISPRTKSVKNIPSQKYKFVKDQNEDDLSFRRVGVYAGKCKIIKDEKFSSESHLFIKFNTPINLDDICLIINNIKWEHNNTTGPKSISKNELIFHLNMIINNF